MHEVACSCRYEDADYALQDQLDAFGELVKIPGVEVIVGKKEENDQLVDYPVAPVVGVPCSNANGVVFTHKVPELVLRDEDELF